MTYSIFLTIIFSIAFAMLDYWRIKERHAQGESINHGWRVVLRFIVGILIAFIYWEENFLNLLLLTLANFAIFWIAFELSLNFMMGWSILHIGTTAWLDKFVRKVGSSLGLNESQLRWSFFVFKLALLTIFITIFYIK